MLLIMTPGTNLDQMYDGKTALESISRLCFLWKG